MDIYGISYRDQTVKVRGITLKILKIAHRVKISENGIFLSPRVALSDRMIKFQRTSMKIQVKKRRYQGKNEESSKSSNGVLLSVRMRDEEMKYVI